MTVDIKIDPTRATDYETIFILRPDIDAEASEKVIARALGAIEGTYGKLTKIESWGRRRLAYPIARQRKGVYVYLRYLGFRGTVAELERNLRMLDPVIRHMTVQLAKDINIQVIEVDPDEVKVRRIEVSDQDDDREESYEASLGLADDHGERFKDRDRAADADNTDGADGDEDSSAEDTEAAPSGEA